MLSSTQPPWQRHNRDWEVYGIRDGYNGLLMPEQYVEGGLVPLTPERVKGITSLGGTIIGTTNRGNPLHYPIKGFDGQITEIDRSDELLRAFQLHQIDALISVGGDGSMTIANALAQKGLWVVGVPKTIDNDLEQTVITFGFDTATAFATECLDRLHTTAASHRRVIVVEVMGRYAGWIALESWYFRFSGCGLDPGNSIRSEYRGREDPPDGRGG